MIDMAKAIELFHEQYKERYGKDGIFEPGETTVVLLKKLHNDFNVERR